MRLLAGGHPLRLGASRAGFALRPHGLAKLVYEHGSGTILRVHLVTPTASASVPAMWTVYFGTFGRPARARPPSGGFTRRCDRPLTSARKARLITYNPASDVQLPAIQPAKVRPWEADELAGFLEHAAGHRLGALFEVMAFTGLHRGAACALRWSDVNLERGYLVVCSQLVEIRSQVVEGKPKTRSGEDGRVDIGQRTTGALLAQRLAQDVERGEWGSGYTERIVIARGFLGRR